MIAARANQKSAVIFFVKSQQAKSLFLILKQRNENIALESILPINASRSLTGCMNLELHSVI